MADGKILNSGLQYVPQIAVQYIYLDFDGELTSYNGEILSLENVEVQNSSLTEERIKNILAELNARYADQNIVFVTQRPTVAGYSTIFIGKTAAFDRYGSFAGLAETIDEGNANKTDKAFVNLDTTATDTEIISTIAHETDHLLGTLNHGGENLQAYASDDEKMKEYYRYYHYNETFTGSLVSTGLTLWHNSVTLSKIFLYSAVSGSNSHHYYYDSAYGVTIGDYGYLYVSSGGTATATTVNYSGRLWVSSGGTATATTVNSGGYLVVCGVANDVVVDGGQCSAAWSGTINEITVLGGELYLGSDCSYNGVTLASGVRITSAFGQNAWGSNVMWTQQGAKTASIAQMSYFGINGNASNLNGYGHLTVRNGGIIENTVLSSGSLTIVSNGSARETTVLNGTFSVGYGGSAENTVISGGVLFNYDGIIKNTFIGSDCTLKIYNSGGNAYNTTLSHRGKLIWNASSSWEQQGPQSAFIAEMNGQGLTGTATNLNGSGTLAIRSGGKLENTTLSGGSIRISSGGKLENTTLSGGSIRIYDGGTATQTVISNGSVVISSGGVAKETTISSGLLSNGGVIDKTTVCSAASLELAGVGASAYNTTLYNGGKLTLQASSSWDQQGQETAFISKMDNYGLTGTATNLNGSGTLVIRNGGVAVNTTLSGGSIWISSGAMTENTTLSGGSIWIFSGAMTENTTLSGGFFSVGHGAVANNTVCSSGGLIWLAYINQNRYWEQQGEVAASITQMTGEGLTGTATNLNGSGSLRILEGGKLENTTLCKGYTTLFSGAAADKTVIGSDAGIMISSGAIAENTVISSGGSVLGNAHHWYQKNEIAASITQMTGEGLTGTATNLNGSGSLRILEGGVAINTTLSGAYAHAYISSGGVAEVILVKKGAYLAVSSGGSASLVYNPWGGTVTSSAGAIIETWTPEYEYYFGNYASGIVSKGNGITGQTVSSGLSAIAFEGSVRDTTVFSGGVMHISSTAPFKKSSIQTVTLAAADLPAAGGVTGNTADGGSIKIYGNAFDNTAKNGGCIDVYALGLAENNRIEAQGTLYANDQSTLRNTTIAVGGKLTAKTANLYDTTINGSAVISGGTVNNITVLQGGNAAIKSNAVLQGDLTLGGTMNISGIVDAAELETFTFSLDSNSVANTTAMLNNIALLNDVDNFSISITSDLSEGKYKLAGNAANFSKDVTLTVDGTVAGVFQWQGKDCNTIRVGDDYYTLNVDKSNNLCFTPVPCISVTYSIDKIDQIIYYNGPRESEFQGIVMKVPYSATATITLDKEIPDGVYEFVAVLEGIEGAEQEFQIEVLNGTPVYLSTNMEMCINGTKISETSSNTTWEIKVEDFILTEKIEKSMSVTPAGAPGAGASTLGSVLISDYSGKDVTVSTTSEHSDANKDGVYLHCHISYKTGFFSSIRIDITPLVEKNIQTVRVKLADGTIYEYEEKLPKYEREKAVIGINIPREKTGLGYDLRFTYNGLTGEYSNLYEVSANGTKLLSDDWSKVKGTENGRRFYAPHHMHCWLAAAVNMLHDAGYIETSAQECFEALSPIYYLSDGLKSIGALPSRLFKDLGLNKAVYTIYNGDKYNVNVERQLTHLEKNKNILAFLAISNGQDFHAVTCYSVDWENQKIIIADSDQYLTQSTVATYSIKKGKDGYYIHNYLEGKDWLIYGTEILIPKNENQSSISYLDLLNILPTPITDEVQAKKAAGILSQDSVTTVSGSIENAFVLSEGTLEIAAGALGDTITIHDMGVLKLHSGASVSGKISTNGGTIFTESGINFAEDVSLKFDLISLEGKESAMLDDLANMTDIDLTVTVEAFQAEGRYVLANGAAGFNGEISVYGDWGSSYTLKLGFFTGELGTLRVGEELKIGDQLYSLDIENDSLVFTVSAAPLAVWDITANTTALTESPVTVTAVFSDDIVLKQYSLDGETWSSYDEAGVVVSEDTTLYFRGANAQGNYSTIASFDVSNIIIRHTTGSADGVILLAEDDRFLIEYSKDNFESYLPIKINSGELSTYGLAEGTYNWQFWVQDTGEWHLGNDIVVATTATEATQWVAKADGNADLFFGNANGVWGADYAAQHLGNGAWNGTREQVLLEGKNKISDLFEGSTDANVLVLTDDANGDALFVDDIYTALGDHARFAQIDEIRAGAGDDIVDMTSERYAYEGDGITIYGGSGNDTIWGGAESNTLFGDAGNDRLVGSSGDDVIAGGSGNDAMHGGGGDDIFTFGGAFGNDTIEQLANGSVTLWFETGSEDNWDAETLTYSDGTNTVSVSGSVNVMLRFGADASLPAGSFEEETTRKVFEDKGMLA